MVDTYLQPLLQNLMEGLILTEEDIMNQLPQDTDKDQEKVDYL